MDNELKGLIFTMLFDLIILLFCIYLKHKLSNPVIINDINNEDNNNNNKNKIPKTPRSRRKSVLRYLSSHNHGGVKLKKLHLPLQFEIVFKYWEKLFGRLPVRNSSASIYLRFQIMSIILLCILSIIETPLLIPLYIQGQNRIMNPHFLERMSVANVPVTATAKLYIEFCCVLLTVTLSFIFVWIFIALVQQTAVVSMELINKEATKAMKAMEFKKTLTLHLYNVNHKIVDENELKIYLDTVLPGEVAFCHIALDYSKLSELYDKYKYAKKLIERYTVREEKLGHDIMIGGCCGYGSVRAKMFYRHLRQQLEEDIHREQIQPKKGTGHIFLVFHSEPSLHVVRNTFISAYNIDPNPKYNIPDWEIEAAPHPSDIIWDNLHISASGRNTRAWIISFFLFLVTVCLITPVAVLQEFDPLIHSVKNAIAETPDNPIRIIITQYSPALIVYIVNVGLTPVFVDLAAEYERNWLHSEEEQSIFRKDYFFMLCNSVFIPMLALNSIASFLVLTYSTDWTQWNQILGRTFLSSSGSFAIKYVIHAGILGAGAAMIDFSNRFKKYWQLYFAKTEKERRDIKKKVWEYEFGYWYAVRATVLVLILLYSTSMPLIIPFGIIYFSAVFYVDQMNFHNGWYNFRFETNGSLEYAVSRYLYLGIVFVLLAMSGLFIVRGGTGNYTLGGILMTFVFITLGFYWSSFMPIKPEIVKQKIDQNEVKKYESERKYSSSDEEDNNATIIDSSDSEAETRLLKLQTVPTSEVYTHPLSRANNYYLNHAVNNNNNNIERNQSDSDNDSDILSSSSSSNSSGNNNNVV